MAFRLVSDLGLDAKIITPVYKELRMMPFHMAEQGYAKLPGEIEMDESYSGEGMLVMDNAAEALW